LPTDRSRPPSFPNTSTFGSRPQWIGPSASAPGRSSPGRHRPTGAWPIKKRVEADLTGHPGLLGHPDQIPPLCAFLRPQRSREEYQQGNRHHPLRREVPDGETDGCRAGVGESSHQGACDSGGPDLRFPRSCYHPLNRFLDAPPVAPAKRHSRTGSEESSGRRMDLKNSHRPLNPSPPEPVTREVRGSAFVGAHSWVVPAGTNPAPRVLSRTWKSWASRNSTEPEGLIAETPNRLPSRQTVRCEGDAGCEMGELRKWCHATGSGTESVGLFSGAIVSGT